MVLKDVVIQSAKKVPKAEAVRGPDGILTYRQLDNQANAMARAMRSLGVNKGDRVGIWLNKSTRAVIATQGILRLGAAYVPLDPQSPASRVKTILQDCSMRALISTAKGIDSALTGSSGDVASFSVDERDQGMCWNNLGSFSEAPFKGPNLSVNDLAYILYTSGSTGKPKGVCISNRNALAFIDWAVHELQANQDDRFSNHAPFHFDLSVLDLYAAFRVGASVSLVPEMMSYIPKRLVNFIQQEQISIWYSVPSALIIMMEQGGLLEQPEIPLRAILFAGEPFPIKHLRRLFKRWPSKRFLNLYGPTETNVCTFYEVKEIEEDRTKPVSIGKECSGDRVWAIKADGTLIKPGEEGELMVSGPTVMLGYWGRSVHGDTAYPTGDLVRLEKDGNYDYVGRCDHMVKVRGHRIELGEIEAALGDHPHVHETAVVVSGSGIGARLVAFIVCRNFEAPTLLDIKRHCSERLPRYMIVDELRVLEQLPRTRNGKVDRLKLNQEANTIHNHKN